MTNFDVTYGWFDQTYYAARLPMILPGLLLNSFLSPVAAHVVLHVVFILAGAAFLYLLVRALRARRAAHAPVLLDVAYLEANSWDCVDGFVITYLTGGLYFLLSSIRPAADPASRSRASSSQRPLPRTPSWRSWSSAACASTWTAGSG